MHADSHVHKIRIDLDGILEFSIECFESKTPTQRFRMLVVH